MLKTWVKMNLVLEIIIIIIHLVNNTRINSLPGWLLLVNLVSHVNALINALKLIYSLTSILNDWFNNTKE